MKVSVIISLCDNRLHLFKQALDTWAYQTMPKWDFEILVMDDAQREDLRELCKNRAKTDGLDIQFIRIDKTRSRIPVKSFLPILTINVGFRKACGEIVVVTGPETLQAPTNLDNAWFMRERKECMYGLVFRANVEATEYFTKNWDQLRNLPFECLLKIPGAQAGCVTRPPHPPAYAYFIAVAKTYVEKINGFDEKFLGGICAEDDDFANRMRMIGVIPTFEHCIIGIHQDHSREDINDGIHINRKEGLGYHMWVRNFTLMKSNLVANNPIANTGYKWGNDNLIILHEKY